MKTNEGEVPQYYVENSYEAIIQPEEWEAVQKEIARRKTLGSRSAAAVFSPLGLSAVTAVVFTAQRSGDPQVSTAR